MFVAFNNQKALVYDETKLGIPPKVLLYGVLQGYMRVSIKQGELAAKGIYAINQGQVLNEVLFQPLESFGLQVLGHAREGAVLDLNQAMHLARPGALPLPHHARDGRT